MTTYEDRKGKWMKTMMNIYTHSSYSMRQNMSKLLWSCPPISWCSHWRLQKRMDATLQYSCKSPGCKLSRSIQIHPFSVASVSYRKLGSALVWALLASRNMRAHHPELNLQLSFQGAVRKGQCKQSTSAMATSPNHQSHSPKVMNLATHDSWRQLVRGSEFKVTSVTTFQA